MENDLDINFNLNDIFYSVQGEGKYLGMPTLFFRFNKCNIVPKCYYCDTNFEKSNVNNDNIVSLIKSFIDTYPIRQICFTGGEPLLFKREINMILYILYDKLNFNGFDVKIETNGLIKLPDMIPFCRNTIYTITPKFEHIHKYKAFNFNNCNTHIFKFMMDTDEYKFEVKLDWIYSFLEQHHISVNAIYFSPINKINTIENILESYKQVFRNLSKYHKHPLFSSFHMNNFKGITFQLHKLLEWQ